MQCLVNPVHTGIFKANNFRVHGGIYARINDSFLVEFLRGILWESAGTYNFVLIIWRIARDLFEGFFF